jgi:hypothetical protein
MSDMIRLEDLSADEIAELLELPPDQAGAILQFVQNVGGIENAYDAVEMLEQVRDAA